jgi:iron complex outermembrane receptor protein
MIKNYGYRTIYDALKDVPGFFPIQDTNDKLMGARGIHATTNQKFLFLFNGKRVGDNLWNYTDIDYNVSLENIKRIEVIRGPGSAIYGRSALTAVINVVTMDGKELDGIKLDVSAGNYGYRKFGFSAGTRDAKGNDLTIWGHMVQMDGQVFNVPKSNDGATYSVNATTGAITDKRVDGTEIVDNFKFPNGNLGARFKNDKWELNVNWMMRNYQDPRATNGALVWQDVIPKKSFDESFQNYLMGEQHNMLMANVQRNFKLGKVNNSFEVNYTYSRHYTRETLLTLREWALPASANVDTANAKYGMFIDFELLSRRLGAEYSGNIIFNDLISVTWGAQANTTKPFSDMFASNFDSKMLNGKLTRVVTDRAYYRVSPHGMMDIMREEQEYSSYAELKYNINEKIILNVGGRFDMHVKGEDFKQEKSSLDYPDAKADEKRKSIKKVTSQFSPRIALVYMPFGSQVLISKLIYSRSFIAPSMFYRYSDPVSNYSGGPWLLPETLDNYMFSLQSIKDNLSVRLSGFININSNLLIQDATLSPIRYSSLGKIAQHGIEFDGMYRLPIITINAAYTFLQANRNLTDSAGTIKWIMKNNSLNNFPTHSGSLGATFNMLKKQLFVTLNERWSGKIYSQLGSGEMNGTEFGADANGNYTKAKTVKVLNPLFLTDLTVRYIQKYFEDLDISFNVYNILDQQYVLGGSVKRPYSQAGRWFNVMIVKKF